MQDEKARVAIKFTVDDEQYTTDDRTLTPTQILHIAGIDPATHYLVEIKNKRQVSYRDQPNEEIRINKDDKFVSVFMGPTPVSWVA